MRAQVAQINGSASQQMEAAIRITELVNRTSTASQDARQSNTDSLRKTDEVPLTREELYELVWLQPMMKIVAEYKVSSSYLCRVSPELTETHHRPKRPTASTLPLSMESSRT